MRVSIQAPVSITFSLLCMIGLVFTQFLKTSIFVFNSSFSFVNPYTWYEPFLYIFGHADMSHLIGNLSFILLLGPILEKKYSVKLLVLLIIITELVTAFVFALSMNGGLIGSSGIVFMFIILTASMNIKQNNISLSFILVVLIFLGKEVMESFNSDQTSQLAHIIGGACGGVFGYILGQRTESHKSDNLV